MEIDMSLSCTVEAGEAGAHPAEAVGEAGDQEDAARAQGALQIP